jgi:hypothetical protein
VATGAFTGSRAEHEVGFQKVAGRYFRVVLHETPGGPAEISIAELNLLGSAVEIPDLKRIPELPPLADAIERFTLLQEVLEPPPTTLGLTPTQRTKWQRIHRGANSRWSKQSMAAFSIFDGDGRYAEVSKAAARMNLSPVDDANLYGVAALPQLSTAAQRAEMAAFAKGMRQTRVDFLSAIKRILSATQQEELKVIVATAVFKSFNGEWRDLFNGKSLHGWDGDPRFWTVEDGAITGNTTEENLTEHNTFLIYVGENEDNTPAEFSDFELKLEYRIDGHHSGAQYRSFKLPGETNRWRVGGYQADFDANKASVGAIYDEQGRGILAKRGQDISIHSLGGERTAVTVGFLDDPVTLAAKVVDAPEWNELHIVATRYTLIQYINGVQMSKVVDGDQARRRGAGLIAIELSAGAPMTVQVRDVRIMSDNH